MIFKENNFVYFRILNIPSIQILMITTCKNRFLLFVSFFLLLYLAVYSQETVRVTGDAQTEWYNYESRLEIEKRVKELAVINALEKAFGRVVVSGNATFIENIQTGEKIETNSVFNTIANTSVGGRMQKEISCAFSEKKGYKIVEGKKEEVTEIQCIVSIIAERIATPPIVFDTFTSACTNPNCRTEEFKDNGDFYLFFKSPVSGYLCVFLDDGKTAFRLLPYRGMKEAFESAVPVKADEQLILFSINDNKLPVSSQLVDEYKLTCSGPQELNRLFIIFCDEPIRKPSLNNSKQTELIPSNMNSENFQRWLQINRGFFQEKMQVKIIDVQIRK